MNKEYEEEVAVFKSGCRYTALEIVKAVEKCKTLSFLKDLDNRLSDILEEIEDESELE